MGTLEFDELEWRRDELLAQADQWAEQLGLEAAADRQAGEIRRAITEMERLRASLELSPADARRVEQAIKGLKDQLRELRLAFGV